MGYVGSAFILSRDSSKLDLSTQLIDSHIKPLQYKIVRVAIDLGLFEYLIEAGPDGKTVEEIVTKTGVDELLLRTCNSMASPESWFDC